jgi:two-component system, LuxR family, sensor kinase FixL
MPAADFVWAVPRYWIGDVIGITVVTPFALTFWKRRTGLRISAESLLRVVAILAALTLVFGYGRFYVVFLPIIWMAVRTGIEGASNHALYLPRPPPSDTPRADAFTRVAA